MNLVSKIYQYLTKDEPVSIDARWQPNGIDRRFVDNQIQGIEQHLLDSVIQGVQATWCEVSGTAPAIGDVVCAASTAPTGALVVIAQATASPLASSRVALGVVIRTAGTNVLVALGGILPPSTTGLSDSDPGLVRVNTSTARCEKVAIVAATDFVIGAVDSAGYLTLRPLVRGFSTATVPPAALVFVDYVPGASKNVRIPHLGGGLSTVTPTRQGAVALGWGGSVTHDYATVGGGYSNRASAAYSTVSGGASNYSAASASSCVGGSRGAALHNFGETYHACVDIANGTLAAGDVQASRVGRYGQTTNVIPSIDLGAGDVGEILLDSSKAYSIRLTCVANCLDAPGCAKWIHELFVSVDNTGIVTIVDDTTVQSLPNGNAWTFAVSATGAADNILRLTFTGAGQTVNVHAYCDWNQVIGFV